MKNKTIDVTTAIIEEREAVVNAINASGLPATVSTMVLGEILRLVEAKANQEYESVKKAEVSEEVGE